MGIVLLLMVAFVLAESDSTTVTFVIPASVSHSLSYGGSCSSSNFYFVEGDATIDGTQAGINATSDSAGSNLCENATVAGIVISNIGSVNVNMTANFTAALPTGVVMKVSLNASGYQASCTGTVPTTAVCANVSTTAVTIVNSLTAVSGTQNTWWWTDFSNFNSGVATTGIARTLNTNAVQS